MKKIRYLPFGYQINAGNIMIHPKESTLICELYQKYLEGSSIKKLAEYADRSGIPYRENANGWNKNMISRILEDERYWKGDRFPVLISREIAIQAVTLKKSKTAEKGKMGFLKRKLVCCHCGNFLIRSQRTTDSIIWECKACTMQFGPLSDEELLHVLEGKLNWIGQHPEQIEEKEFCPPSLSIQTARMTNEINQLLDQRQVDAERVAALILDCASEKYRQCRAEQCDHVTMKIKAMFQRHGESGMPIPELLEQTTQKVLLQPDGSIQLQLQNGKII